MPAPKLSVSVVTLNVDPAGSSYASAGGGAGAAAAAATGGGGGGESDVAAAARRSETVVIMAVDRADSQVVMAKQQTGNGYKAALTSESLFARGAGGGKGGSSDLHDGPEDEFSEDHIDFWTLRFREPVRDKRVVGSAAAARSGQLLHSLEDGFLALYFVQFRKKVQKAMITAVAIWALYVINDVQKNSQGLRNKYEETLIIRFTNCAIGLLCTAMLSTQFVQRRRLMMPVVGFAMMTFGVAQIVFGMWDKNELDPAYSVIMLLLPSTSSTLFKQRFIFTVVFQFLLLFLYITLTYAFDRFHSASDLLLTAVGLFFANILFAIHAYRREHKMRVDYLTKLALEREETRSQNLLLRMLPASVICKLREGSDFVYYKHDAVTLLFSHISDFDEHTSAMAPLQLIRMLNTLFTRFDELTDRHGIYKVETIGDVYLVSSGCPVEYARDDHAEAVAAFALDMMDEAKKFMVEHARDVAAKAARKIGVDKYAAPSKGHGQAHVSKLCPIQLQLGINTGGIIAGVVGVKYPRYRLMGDTINVASRMSTTASANQIQMTTRAHELLNKDWFRTEYKGEVAVKGKGLMKTYLLIGRIEGACPPPTNLEQVQVHNGTYGCFAVTPTAAGEDGAQAGAFPAQQTEGQAVQDPALRGPRDSPTNESIGLPGNRRGSMLSPNAAAKEMRPAELPGVPEMLQKLKGGEVGGADLRGRRPSQSFSDSVSRSPRSVTPSALQDVEDGLAGVLEHNGGEGQLVHITDEQGRVVKDEQVIGDGVVLVRTVREGDIEAPTQAVTISQPSPLLSPDRVSGLARTSPVIVPHGSPGSRAVGIGVQGVRAHRATSSTSIAPMSSGGDADPPSSTSSRSSSNKKVVLSAQDQQSAFKSMRLFSFGPMNAILQPQRTWKHRLRLDQSFVTDPRLELEFQYVYAKNYWRVNRNWVNFMWIFLLLLSMYDVINNMALSSAIVGYSWLVRLVGVGAGVWFYYASQRSTYLRWMQPATCVVVTVIGVVFISTTALTSALLKAYGVSFSLVLLSFVCMFVALRFHYALVSVCIILVAWIVAAAISEGSVPGILSVLLAGSVMYLETSYNTETEARHDFVRFRKLYHERMSTHSFLSNLLPPSVFEGLRREDQALVAHERTDADVLFSDIVGFTATAATLKPEDVVAVLNVMFATFDVLADKYGVFKVETIGDAYVACANVVELGRPDHTKLLVDFALAMQRSTRTMFTSTNQPIIIRVGIHTGTLIAGVVGRKMPRYHLFGQTVTIAEEMEQRGVPGAVALSEAAYRSMPPGSLWEYECKQLEDVVFDGVRIARWTVAPLPKKAKGDAPFGSPSMGAVNRSGAGRRGTLATPLLQPTSLAPPERTPSVRTKADGSFPGPALDLHASPGNGRVARLSVGSTVGNGSARGVVQRGTSDGSGAELIAALYGGTESSTSPLTISSGTVKSPSSAAALQTPGATSTPLAHFLQKQAAAAAVASPSRNEPPVAFIPQ